MLISLGALIADVAHTLPVPITGLASEEKLVEELGLSRSNYEGPTGIVGVLHDQARQRSMPSASLWAAVPHYVAAVPNPKAALALLRRLEGLTGVALEASELEDAMERFDDQVNRAVSANPEIEELVRRLESEQDDEIELPEVPSGDALARDFQRFLRQRPTTTSRGGSDPNQRPNTTAAEGSDPVASGLASRADQPVVAPGADLERRPRLEVLRLDASRDVEDGALDPLGVVGRGLDLDPLVGEDIPVRALGRLELPGLAGGHAVERELEVLGELRCRRLLARLVVDQLISAVGALVHPVDPPSEVMIADREREAPLEPDRLGLLAEVALVVASERGDGPVAVLKLVVGRAEAGPPPPRLEQPEQAGRGCRAERRRQRRRRASASLRNGSARGRCGSGSRTAG